MSLEYASKCTSADGNAAACGVLNMPKSWHADGQQEAHLQRIGVRQVQCSRNLWQRRAHAAPL
jgi:hypothetical protein